jgi:multiple antibiotic resistance protein
MLTIFALTIKKTITLLVLVGPVSMIPIFLAASDGLDMFSKVRFAKTIGFSVTVALLVATFLGMPILGLLGVSFGAMQFGGGIIVLLLAIAMILGKESTFKGSPSVNTENDVQDAAIIPLATKFLVL